MFRPPPRELPSPQRIVRRVSAAGDFIVGSIRQGFAREACLVFADSPPGGESLIPWPQIRRGSAAGRGKLGL